MSKEGEEALARVRHCVVANEEGPSIAEMSQRCAAAGFGDQVSEDYNSEPVVVNGYLMPRWMAEVLGRIGKE